MKLIHGISATVADTFPKRAKGLLGRDGLPSGEGLLIPRCNAIHTIGMRFPIDAEFLARDGSTVRVVRDIPPGRPLVWGGWRARQVLETQAGVVRARELIHKLVSDGVYAGLIAADADGGLPSTLSSDGTHPNKDAYTIMEGVILPILQEVNE